MADPESVNEGIARDPGAFMQQMDLLQQRALFVRVAESELRAASFLDDRMGMQGREGFWVPLDNLTKLASVAAVESTTPSFIFHIGHCGSTLLSRLLDQSAGVLGLREPLVLREIAALERELDTPLARMSRQRWTALFDETLTMLGRKFSAGQHIVVKATSNCNNLIEPLLSTYDRVRAVLLFIPLQSYLATMLKAPGGGLDARHSAPGRLQFLHRHLDDDSLRLYDLDIAETLAMGWIAELARFGQVASLPAIGDRILSVNFEELLVQPGRELSAVRRHLHISDEALDDASVSSSPVMRGYAKSPAHPYTIADRQHDLELSRKKFGAEIERGMRWATDFLAAHANLRALDPLLGQAGAAR